MTRASLAAAILLTALCGGFFVGAIRTFCEDTGPDW